MSVAKQHYTETIPYKYRLHGNDRPSQPELEAYIDGLLDKPTSPLSVERGEEIIALASMLIDLAVLDNARASDHLEEARGQLHTLTSFSEHIAESKGLTLSHDMSSLTVTAYLQKSELTYWRQVIEGQNVAPTYDERLAAAEAASKYAGGGLRASINLEEYVPLLLGALLTDEAPDGVGWYGRPALLREDRKSKILRTSNPNWDCSTALDTSPLSYIAPPVKLQIKRGRVKRRKAYSAHGIIAISSREYGFHEPVKVVDSCSWRKNRLPDGAETHLLFSNEALHEMGRRLLNRVCLPEAVDFEQVRAA